jgi:L-arabinokinase
VQHSAEAGIHNQMRAAAFMAHAMILQQMRKIGHAAGRELIGDPMRGYLANLDPEDFKQTFREHLPEKILGREFLDRFGTTDSPGIDPDSSYFIQHAADHHVLEARRVQRFVEFLSQANSATGSSRKLLLDKAGHLMYASHLSYSNDAMLGCDECDLLVKLVRERELAGMYGARITSGGGGGTVAILAGQSAATDSAINEIMTEYERQTGKHSEVFGLSSPGAWHVGTQLVRLQQGI